MENYLLYNLKVALALGVFYAIYRFFLKKDTFFGQHRAYLLFSVLLSFILPLVEITLQRPVLSRIPVVFLNTFQVNASSSSSLSVNAGTLLQKILIYGYPVITIILFLKFLYRLTVLALQIITGEKHRKGNFIFVVENKDIPVYSFFNYVFIGKNQAFPDREIFAHEAVHAVQLHSLDTLIIEIVTIIQWFNPFIWLYRKELKETHEYLADAGVMKQGFSMAEYLLLLFNHAVGFNFVGLTKNFNQSLIKKRIKMMKREKSCPWAKFKLLLIIPAASLLCFGFAKGTKVNEISKKSISQAVSLKENLVQAVNSNDNAEAIRPEMDKDKPAAVVSVPVSSQKDTADQEKPYTYVQQMPAFPGGINALMKFLSDNIKYPEQAIKEGKNGTVVVRFVVDQNGNIQNPEILRQVCKELDEEAIRVVSLMPRWEPGKEHGKTVSVYFVLPIKFALNKEKSSK